MYLPVVTQYISGREALSLHAEVRSMQLCLSISYQDAAHRLYAEAVGKLQATRQEQVGLAEVCDRIDNILIHEIDPAVKKIDKGWPTSSLNGSVGSSRDAV